MSIMSFLAKTGRIEMTGKRLMITGLGTITILLLLFLSRIDFDYLRNTPDITDIKSITIEASKVGFLGEELIPVTAYETIITVTPNGQICDKYIKRKNTGEIESESVRTAVVSQEQFARVVEILEESHFVDIPDDLSPQLAITAQSAYNLQTIIVETDSGVYRKSGYNIFFYHTELRHLIYRDSHDRRFAYCLEHINRILRSASWSSPSTQE